jgi:NarL family two-component system response regulator YdfI
VIRLLIAAPSADERARLEALAASSPELQVVGSFPDLAGTEALDPHVVLSTVLPDDVAAPALVLVTDAQHVWTQEALRMGLRAVLPRGAAEAEILAAVDAAAHGLAVIDPLELESLLASPAAAQRTGESPELTPRELEVLRMLAEGAPNKIIAWKLGISEHTVKFHVASILARLGAGSRTEAVTIGIRKGLVMV